MNWSDEAIIISSRKQGENAMILSVLTQNHGLYSGLVSSAKKYLSICQPGNFVYVQWSARLEEHLGFFTCESIKNNAHNIMFDRLKLHAVNSLCSLLIVVLQERENNNKIYWVVNEFIKKIVSKNANSWLVDYVYFELYLLAELGYGLDLEKCAVTGKNNSLYYVSPKTGRAVSKNVGEPYKDKLLRLPDFLNCNKSDNINGTSSENKITNGKDFMEIIDGISLTRYFLKKCVFSFEKKDIPVACDRFVKIISENTEYV